MKGGKIELSQRQLQRMQVMGLVKGGKVNLTIDRQPRFWYFRDQAQIPFDLSKQIHKGGIFDV
jgi:hypothetical protein